MPRPRVHVVFTGGTISMRIDPHAGGAVPALSGEEILSRVSGLRREARISSEDYSRLPGPHVTPQWMWRLRRHVAAVLADPQIDGVVLTHGTDTVEETAFLLDLTLDSPKPVVFCGAMRTVSEPSWDGPANLVAAVKTAAHADSRNRGVLVTMGDAIYAAAEVTKTHTLRLDAFDSPNGALGLVDRGHVLYHRAPHRTPTLRARRLVPEVDLHVMVTGVEGKLLQASLERGARGIVIEGTGAGNVPPAVVSAIRAAISRGVPVVLVSRCPQGRVSPVYGYRGGGEQLRRMGVIFGEELPGQKARIKLMVALGITSRLDELRRLFSPHPSAL